MTPTRYYGANSLLAVIADGWKYIETTRPELYDLRSDPAEAVNLLAREPARADALSRTLVAILPRPAALRDRLRSPRLSTRSPGSGWPPSATWAGAATTSSQGFDRSKEDPKDLITFFRKDQRLNKLVEEKKYAEARALCDDMLRQRPGFADCRLQMSKIAAAEGNLDAARTAAAKAVAVGPKNERAHLQLAALLRERGDLDGAIAHFRQALALEPGTPDTRMWLGRALAEKGQLDEAASLLGPAAAGQPESATGGDPARLRAGQAGQAAGGHRELPPRARARPRLGGGARLSRLRPRLPGPVGRGDHPLRDRAQGPAGQRGASRLARDGPAREGRPDEALVHFREAVRLGPGLAMAHLNLGRALKQQGKLDEAVSHYRRALALDPRLAAAHNSLGSALGSQGLVREAIREFREALRLQPDNEEAHNNLGLALRLTESAIRRSPSSGPRSPRKPDWPGPMSEVAWILATHSDSAVRDPAQAVRLAERAADLTGRRSP